MMMFSRMEVEAPVDGGCVQIADNVQAPERIEWHSTLVVKGGESTCR